MTLLQRDNRTPSASNPEPATGVASEAQHSPLLLLTTDAASINARRLHSFADAESATGFIRFWFPPDSHKRIAAFWALPAPPIQANAEAIVLIRHPSDPGLVYPFSFPAMDEALCMARSEMRRGLRIGSFAIYHAVRVAFDTAPDGHILPTVPPQFERPALTPREATLMSSQLRAAPEESIVSRAFHAMRLRRWTWHATPFAGFGSPPGRF